MTSSHHRALTMVHAARPAISPNLTPALSKIHDTVARVLHARCPVCHACHSSDTRLSSSLSWPVNAFVFTSVTVGPPSLFGYQPSLRTSTLPSLYVLKGAPIRENLHDGGGWRFLFDCSPASSHAGDMSEISCWW